MIVKMKHLLEPNPILVRELKQFVRNRLLLYFMLFYLGTISLVTVVVLAMPELVKGITFFIFWFSECTGQELFAFVMLSYYFFASAFLVLFGGVKLGYERYKNDLGYYTTVPPWRIISGKFLLGVVVSLIFLSLSLPFLTIAYMMRGLDLATIIMAVLFYFFMSLVHYSVTIAFYAGARSLTRIYLFGLLLAFLQFVGFCIGYAASSGFIYYPEIMGSNRWVVLMPYAIQWAFIFFPLPFAICQVSPESSNRMMPVRVCMTVVFLLAASGFTVSLILDLLYPGMSSTDFNTVIGMSSCIALDCIFIFYPIIFLINICEREKYSIRQRRFVPRNRLLRFLYFLHATGVANAILWYLLFLIASMLLFFAWRIIVSINDGYHEYGMFVKDIFWRLLAFAIMVYCWTVATFGLWKLFLYRILPREWLSFPLFCFGIICFIFYCVAMAAFYIHDNLVSMLFAIFPIVVFEEKGVMTQYFFGVIGMIVLAIISIGMSVNAYNALSPYDTPKILSESELQEIVQRSERRERSEEEGPPHSAL